MTVNTPIVNLRSEPKDLSIKDAKEMILTLDFFESNMNWKGIGLPHKYELEAIRGDKIIKDGVTGLIWQKGGSVGEELTFDEAKEYIDKLNTKKFAGFNDWRLPTLEEAMSLMDPKQNKKELYINPMFDSVQTIIWTSDKAKCKSAMWCVSFHNGGSHDEDLFNEYCDCDGDNFVRAVRSG